MKKWSNTYYENNKDGVIKKYLERTKEHRLSYGKEYYKTHKEERKKYYEANKERILEYNKKYIKEQRKKKKEFKNKLLEMLKGESE